MHTEYHRECLKKSFTGMLYLYVHVCTSVYEYFQLLIEQVNKNILYTRKLVAYRIGGVKSMETRFDWNGTRKNDTGLYLAHSVHSKIVHSDAGVC